MNILSFNLKVDSCSFSENHSLNGLESNLIFFGTIEDSDHDLFEDIRFQLKINNIEFKDKNHEYVSGHFSKTNLLIKTFLKKQDMDYLQKILPSIATRSLNLSFGFVVDVTDVSFDALDQLSKKQYKFTSKEFTKNVSFDTTHNN